MNREVIRDYLFRTEMNEAQAEALSHIFAQLATKDDLRVLEERVERRLSVFEERFETRLHTVEYKVGEQMAHLKVDLTWRMIAIVGFFGTVITLLNTFVG